jgi:hypothetical protein
MSVVSWDDVRGRLDGTTVCIEDFGFHRGMGFFHVFSYFSRRFICYLLLIDKLPV